ncbi:inositol monophosphatase family protein [Halobellus clavatus]|jgi:myo-inositol-1(or 4)-monophosphatase|uniref:fructose-bisphosphatase n=1 Tax=Halobellus clavatus TaxID=660517 RepID=A0A1H3F1I6_9EURY|nr:inositol monophosphatase [Halobellus clavatus]SDX84750.1 myo-inositol-1(or 4)-monophosphatase [Halobellus clavatus]
MSHGDRVGVARRAAAAGATLATERFRTDLDVEQKDGKTDVVTQADRDAQTAVIEEIEAAYPDDAVVGEEARALKSVPATGAAWIVDPIDGTNNYVRGLRTWGTAVAAVRDGDPVAAAVTLPALGDEYWTDGAQTYRNGDPVSVSTEDDPEAAVVTPTMWWDFDARDQYGRACQAMVDRFGDLRRLGCAQAELAAVADGSLDGVATNLRAHPWDTVAGVAMIRAAGGTVTDLAGDRWRHDSVGLVASNGEVHDTLLAAARDIDPVA